MNSLIHEIINPLNIIIGSAELLKLDDKELKNQIDKKKLLENIIQQSKNCCNMLKTELEKNSIVGAGSVITKNVKKKVLALTRAQQVEIKNYKRKKK